MGNICYRSLTIPLFPFSPTNRSNGIVNVGFVMYHSMKTVATETILFVRSRNKRKKAKKCQESNGKAHTGHQGPHIPNGHIVEEDPLTILWRIASGKQFKFVCLSA